MENLDESKIINFFKTEAVKGLVMLTIPHVMSGLEIDRRRTERTLALMAKGVDPTLYEIPLSRIKYYVLRDIVEFCKNKWGQ